MPAQADARYNDLARWNSSGRCRDANIPAWWAHGNDHCICANILPALLPTRIGSVDPHALKTTARRTESTLPGNAPSLRAEAGHLRLACRLVRIAAQGARNGRLPNDLWCTSRRNAPSTGSSAGTISDWISALPKQAAAANGALDSLAEFHTHRRNRRVVNRNRHRQRPVQQLFYNSTEDLF